MIRINGSTRILAVLGHPVQHSLSPAMHNAAIAALGLDAVYIAVEVDRHGLPHLLRGFETVGIGGNVTVPHKVVAANLLGRKTDLARELDAVNTFWHEDDRLVGDNTDVGGVLDALERLDAVGPWLVAGTGGTARAVAAAARETSTTFLLQSRDPARAQDFVKWARNFGTDAHADDGRQVGTAINTTPLGLHRGDAEPVAAERLTGCAVALDLVYGPGGTEWSRGCHERGMRVSDGRTVLVGQGMRAFQRFFPGHDPPGEVMAAAVNRKLESE